MVCFKKRFLILLQIEKSLQNWKQFVFITVLCGLRRIKFSRGNSGFCTFIFIIVCTFVWDVFQCKDLLGIFSLNCLGFSVLT